VFDRAANCFGPGQVAPRQFGRIFILVVIGCLTFTVAAAYGAGTNQVTVMVTDAKTGAAVSGAKVFLDGAYAGMTSSADAAGTLHLAGIGAGTHTLRVTCQNYRESVKKFPVSGDGQVTVELDRSFLQSLTTNGTANHAINVVFFPSATSFDCSTNSKVSTPRYTNESSFKEDVVTVINHTYLNLDHVTDSSDRLAAGYQGRFNFYYYFDPSAMGDAFDGCSGSVPSSYWNDVTFADVTVLLYPTYYGGYTKTSCQPIGCYQSAGTGRGVMKAPADQYSLFLHETGHAIFGLVDTYGGDTWHYEIDPYPNLWSSLASCQSDASANGRDSSRCRSIGQTSSVSGSGEFWRWDPDPDIMAAAYYGQFGAASTRRIDYVLAQSGRES
jgi:hypothetical protein